MQDNSLQNESLQEVFTSLDRPLTEQEIIISGKLLRKFDEFSPWTREHSERVGNMSGDFASFLGANNQVSANFALAATLHDVGKLNIPEPILNTEKPLNKEQFEKFFKQHSKDSEIILKEEFAGIEGSFIETAVAIGKEHHEKFNGSGYPAGKGKKDINISAQMVSLCDVFDAMNYSRPYQKELAQGDILCRMIDPNNIRLSGSFEPDLLHSFVSFRLSEYDKSNNNYTAQDRDYINPKQLQKLRKYCNDYSQKQMSETVITTVAAVKKCR